MFKQNQYYTNQKSVWSTTNTTSSTIYGLQFQNNSEAGSTSTPMQAIVFKNPEYNGLPVYGPGNAGVTVIREVKIDHQVSDEGTYYAQFWWSQYDGHFDSGTYAFWGMHPYPKTGKDAGSGHYHEIQCSSNGDYTVTNADESSYVFFDIFDVTRMVWKDE